MSASQTFALTGAVAVDGNLGACPLVAHEVHALPVIGARINPESSHP